MSLRECTTEFDSTEIELTEEVDSTDFRSALGGFATGVTVVTTADNGGAPFGVTASSFNSVSLDPPLVLWSLSKSAKSIGAFTNSGHFAVHVLATDQQPLSNHFARSGGDKFSAVDWKIGVLGSPLLTDYASRFECRTLHQYEGGDHIIFVGEVVTFDQQDGMPLVFHRGSYTELRAV